MNANRWIRRIHRWMSIVFTLAVLVTAVCLWQRTSVAWVTYTPLPPLLLLSLTGLYLFALPYATRWRDRAR